MAIIYIYIYTIACNYYYYKPQSYYYDVSYYITYYNITYSIITYYIILLTLLDMN